MSILQLAWKNISQQWGNAFLSVLLTAFGIAILTVIYISSDTFEKQLDNNSKNIDLVVGAKGSPLQLILSSIYHIDNPTGNISLEEVNKIVDNPLIQTAVPISLGDNYKGHRMIGTDTGFLTLYGLTLQEGQLWQKSFEVVVGAEVARKHGIKIGQQIHSAHGLSADAHVHDDHPFTVTGILDKSNSVVDNLILTNLASVWEVHGIEHHDEHLHSDHDTNDHNNHNQHVHHHDETGNHDDHDHENNDHIHATDHNHEHDENVVNNSHNHKEELVTEKPMQDNFVKSIGDGMITDSGVEITALLIKYSSPAAIGVIPRLINQSTHMQAASPAIESSRIFALIGVGLDSLTILAYVIIVIAGLSIFLSLYNALKERKYDLAIMRTMGATKTKLFALVLVEGLVITIFGGIAGLIMGHIAMYFIGAQTSQSADFVEAFKIYPKELWILIGAIVLGIFAAFIPAYKAYNTTISKTLASK